MAARLLYLLVSWPQLAAAAAALVARPGWSMAALLLILAAAGITWNLIYLVRNNLRVLRRMKDGLLAPFSHCAFAPVELASVLSHTAHEVAAWRPEGLRTSLPRIYRLEGTARDGPVPCTLSTYPLLVAPGYIFLPPFWMPENAMHRFWLHHEIGHASIAQFGVIYRDGMQAVFLVLLALPTLMLAGEHALALPVLGVFWLYWWLRSAVPARGDLLGEIIGDVFAINHLKDAAEAEQIGRLYPMFLQLAGGGAAAARQIREFRSNLARFEQVFRWPEKEREALGMNYISYALTRLTFRNLVGRLALVAGSAWIGTRFRTPGPADLAVLAACALVIPFAWSVVLQRRHQRMIEDVDDFLKMRAPVAA